MVYDYLIVGAGLFGATFAQQATEAGKRCLVIDKRGHIAGNCYTEQQENVIVHMYGPHLFHTNNHAVWKYVQRFAVFNDYHHTVVANTDFGIVPLPINLHTLNTLYGIRTPAEADEYFKRVRAPVCGDNVESWCLGTIGEHLYNLLIRDYTRKQWNRDPRDLPASIIKRLPIRYTYDNRYFTDNYQGVPIGGYTYLVSQMLGGVDVSLNTDFLTCHDLRQQARKIVYSGPLDTLFDNCYGKLDYRSIYMEHRHINVSNYQGIGQVNYTDIQVPYTRSIEHKHFVSDFISGSTVVSWEYPSDDGEPYYPINDETNNYRAEQYLKLAKEEGFIVGGRLGRYQYMDMHQVIAQALHIAKEELRD